MNNRYQNRLNKLENHNRSNPEQGKELLKQINAGRNRLKLHPLSLDLSTSKLVAIPGQAIIDALHSGRTRNVKL